MRVHHLAFRTRDLPRLAAFYEGVLGFAKIDGDRDEAKSVWLRAERTILMLERAEDGEALVASGSKDLVAFAVDAATLGSWRSTLGARGVTIEGATAYTIYFRDPDGRRIGLSGYAP